MNSDDSYTRQTPGTPAPPAHGQIEPEHYKPTHYYDPSPWRLRALFIGFIIAALAVIGGIAYSVSRSSGGDQAASVTQPGVAATSTQQQKPADIGPLAAVSAIAEQPRLVQTSTVNAPAVAANVSGGTVIPAGGSLAGRVVTVDAGHASNPDMSTEPLGPGSTQMKVKDPGGTAGINTDVPEYLVTLSISVYLQDMLEQAGAKVVMTRAGDGFTGGNVERAQIANGAGSSLFVRVHCNGSQNQNDSGASTLYPANIPGWTDDIYAPSKLAAQAIQQALVAETGAADRGVVEREDITGFNWSDVPAVLVETGYLTNPDEDAKFATPEYQQQVARGIFNGIQTFFSQ